MQPPIPTEYIDYLRTNGVFEGFTRDGTEPGYVALWPTEEILRNNADVEMATYAPDYIAFAGDGGGELLAFDLAGAVFMLPMIGLASECAIRIADSFDDLAARFDV
ncbi:SMI1/KNR4 family protein [Burkholderia pseudomallei]|uniref:SMI1/KNR4 family protein n=1 Tax=Burkholderia pseudomallei TaxID=28450 RepID=UPI002DBC9674|nr:SMI1/KNR4 family protein [Burkholderia pseudomallei]MEB5488383.1 SMI1/KNR4 family protein [Burkholderia pseudomallei]MEB5494849.1 SMI1/KNR4 family protein [Burkholderia pseudomallei]MEB5501292.1 SMI1/KNR4 family protein [Burkholderia pseudomallei]MEB5507341.1 SMI1/KNR4 family protein [Burkholderia pseudomallei]MEB5514198.1 SMI1/KNR4 family protein [Burkholderia pseudomallei]